MAVQRLKRQHREELALSEVASVKLGVLSVVRRQQLAQCHGASSPEAPQHLVALTHEAPPALVPKTLVPLFLPRVAKAVCDNGKDNGVVSLKWRAGGSSVVFFLHFFFHGIPQSVKAKITLDKPAGFLIL
jgi:hypothetical protein